MKKILSLLLTLALVAGIIIPGSLAIQANAAEGDSSDAKEGMVINKTATATDDGFEIMLEAYATGNKVISSVSKDVPTDIVLVLDQSGSMDKTMGGLSYEKYSEYGYSYYNDRRNTNSNLYNNRHNGGNENLWYLKDGKYYSVSVVCKETDDAYTAQSSYTPNSTYYSNQSNLYALMGGQYVKVTVDLSDWRDYTYSANGTVIGTGSRSYSSPTITGTDDNKLYIKGKEYSYTYSYTDANGNSVTLGTSTGENTYFTAVDLYYQFTDSGKTKLQTLKDAVTSFISIVSTKAKGIDGVAGTNDDVDHRIAVVGFASTGNQQSNYTNTELLSTANVVNYRSAGVNNYKDALVSVNDTNGNVNSRLTTAVTRLGASGDTYLEYGIDMANKIFEQYPIVASTSRQRVVVVFTDGYPAPNGTNDFKYSMANNAIDQSNTTKNIYEATVYTVGVFDAADPTADITINFAASDGWDINANNLSEAQEQTAANRYMHYVSSNYLSATSLTSGGTLNPKANPFNHGDSYYLVASNSEALNNIFQQIAGQIETSTSTTTLDEETVIKDIIAPQFQLPANATAANITLETYACTGVDTTGKYIWSQNTGTNAAMGAKATVDATNGQVSVTGFDFAGNYVGTVTEGNSTTYRGNKLVIKFTVSPKAGFLGGNDVYTNTSAGVYENANATEPVMTFPRPTVNVPIKDVTVTVEDKNVYLTQIPDDDVLKSVVTVKCGNVDITDPSKLEDWQKAYVNIAAITVATSSGFNATTDGTYTVTAKVSPKTDGSSTREGTTAVETTGSTDGKINVFKPELTYQDSEVYYGDTASTDYSSNKTSELWKHDETLSTGVTMIGSKPALTLTYDPGTGIADGKIATKEDIPVDVTVKIGTIDVTGNTTFRHTDCTGKTCGQPDNGKFWLHVKTCMLTITKAAANGTTIGNDEYFVFNIKKDGSFYTQVTIQGIGSATINELPVGTYTVEEDMKTAWRYGTPMIIGSGALSSSSPTGTITCTNTKTTDYWLNHFARVINTFDKTVATN